MSLPPGVLGVVECPREPWSAPPGARVLVPGQATWQHAAQAWVPGFPISFAATDPAHRVVAVGGGCRLQILDRVAGRVVTEVALASGLRTLRVAPDGTAVAFGVVGYGMVLWDRGQGFVPLKQAGLGYLHSLAFSPDGETLAVVAHDWRVGVWDRGTGRCKRIGELGEGVLPDRLLTHPAWGYAVALVEQPLGGLDTWTVPFDGSDPLLVDEISEDVMAFVESGPPLAAGVDGEGKPVFLHLEETTRDAAMDGRDRWLVEASREGQRSRLIRTDRSTGEADEVPGGDDPELWRSSPSGLSVTREGEVFSGSFRRVRFHGDAAVAPAAVEAVTSLLLDPERGGLWVADRGGVHRHCLRDPEIVSVSLPVPGCDRLCLDAEGRLLAVVHGALASVTDPAYRPEVSGHLWALSEDGGGVAIEDRGRLRIGPLGRLDGSPLVEGPEPQTAVIAFVPGRRELLGVGAKGARLWGERGSPGGRVLDDVPAHAVLAFGPSGETVALADAQGARVVTLDGAAEARNLEVPPVTAGVFLPDGRLVLATLDRRLRVFDLRLGVVTGAWRAGDEAVTGLAVDAKGETLFSGAGDGAVVAWDLERLAARS